MSWLSYQILRALGWQFHGEIPDVPKMVIIGAPHTSNWDFFLFLAAIHRWDLDMRFLGKHTLFRRPFGFMFRKIGGIPVDRATPGGVVEQVRAAFEEEDRMILVVAPEGTRDAARSWKSGFLQIAETSNVPVVCAGVDGPGRSLTISEAIEVGADHTVFMDRLREFYEDKPGLRPALKTPVRLGSEVSGLSLE